MYEYASGRAIHGWILAAVKLIKWLAEKQNKRRIKGIVMKIPAFFNQCTSSYKKYRTWKLASRQTIWYRIWNLFLDLFLALVSVLPLLTVICRSVPFSYEVNDDATIVQILDGSYTGTPDGHSIFVRYPLSWIIKTLYEKNPVLHLGRETFQNVNWYVAVIVMLEVFALTAVLFRLLQYFTYNRILLCILYDVGFVFLWLPCFSNMTFSTAAAFMGCMGVLFFGLMRREEAWRPWNLLILGTLLLSAWCLRKQCFLMVLPFLCLELIFKYHIHFFRSVKPWFIGAFLAAFLGVAFFWNGQMYSSREWKDYLQYNQDRAYLQDYVGFPKYNQKHKAFYDAAGISENGRDAMAKYTYCLVDGFSTDWVEQTWLYVKGQKGELPLAERMEKAVPRAEKYLLEGRQTEESLKEASFYPFLLLAPLSVLTALYLTVKMLQEPTKKVSQDTTLPEKKGRTLQSEAMEEASITKTFPFSNRWNVILSCIKGAGGYLWTLLSIAAMSIILWLEWVYLAMNGRFPQRVEETIRLLTLCAGVLFVCKLLHFWKRNRMTHIPVILQVAVLVLFLNSGLVTARLTKIQGVQQYHLQYAAEKAEVLEYCGAHKDSWFILDTRSFTKMSRPEDDLHQGNWFMSGSWTAYSPLYTKKLAAAGTDSLGSEFLLRDNVFLITKGKKNMSALLGLPENRQAESEIVDEIMSSGNNFYMVYKITGITERKEQ